MTSVLIVDDLGSIREFLKINLSSEPDIQVVGSADNGQGAIAQAQEHQPDIILMDINMPGEMNGIEATERIVRYLPESKILLLTSQDEREQLNHALKAGARGYILKNTSIKDIANIIRLAEKGFFQVGPMLGSWDGQLHNFAQVNSGKIELGRGASQDQAIIPHQFNYSTTANQASRTNPSLSYLSSEIFQLQETIKSQEDTITNLTNQYIEVQQEIRGKSAKKRSPSKKSNLIHGYKYKSRLSRNQQHLLFIGSFCLGIITVIFLILLIMLVK